MSEQVWWVGCIALGIFAWFMTVGVQERVEHGTQSRVWADWVPSK